MRRPRRAWPGAPRPGTRLSLSPVPSPAAGTGGAALSRSFRPAPSHVDLPCWCPCPGGPALLVSVSLGTSTLLLPHVPITLGTCPPAAPCPHHPGDLPSWCPPSSLFSCPHAPGDLHPSQAPWDCHGPHQHPQPGAHQACGDLPFWSPPGHSGPGSLCCPPASLSPARNGVPRAGRGLCCWRRPSWDRWGHFHVHWWLVPLMTSPPLTHCADGARPAEPGLVFRPGRTGAEGGRVSGCTGPHGHPTVPCLPPRAQPGGRRPEVSPAGPQWGLYDSEGVFFPFFRLNFRFSPPNRN
ncbi:LOW QUALITY PROTEIN: uncharacterized protein M6G45_016001, partial [Spheniscus humboldti]